jgi:glucose-6-phosphate-specific signal transduction histidine kinase
MICMTAIAEALANTAKHAAATNAEVSVRELAGRVVAQAGDNGTGGALPDAGSGLRGLADRVAVVAADMGTAPPRGSHWPFIMRRGTADYLMGSRRAPGGPS